MSKKSNNRYIFDMDGMVVDTQTEFHAIAEAHIIKKHHGYIISPDEISRHFAGMPTVKVFEALVPGCNTEFLRIEKWKYMYQMVEITKPKCLPGIYAMLLALSKRGIPMAIASASPPLWIVTCLTKAYPHENVLRERSLLEIFLGRTLTAEECEHPKPAPDVFLKAKAVLDRLCGVADPSGQTYVVGDGRSDVLGGLRAKMRVLYLSKTDTRFDNNLRVKRFTDSKALAQHILELEEL